MEKKADKCRICIVVGKWVRTDGVESTIMNYYKNMDKSKMQFDFVCDEDSINIPYDEIEKLGGRVIICPPYQKIYRYQKFLINLFKQNKYQIVHSNINALSVLPLRAAKKAGVSIRIAHSHSTANKKEWKKTLIKNMFRPFSKKYANVYFACSELAGRWLFGNKTFNEGKVTIINNAIDIDKFKFNEEIRKQKRKELAIKDSTLVIGHVGRFVKQKNHEFLIDVFNEVHKKRPDSVLLLVGQGPLMDDIKKKIKELEIENAVKFLGQRIDINELYNAMDVFVLPSLYEGLGMALVEAQANGMKCIASTEVPKAADVSNCKFISLYDKNRWISTLIDEKFKRIDNEKKIECNGYKIRTEAKKLEKIYLILMKT